MKEKHTAEVDGMKNEIHQLTTDLHERDTTVAGVTEKASTMEQTLRDQNEILDRKTAELEVRDILHVRLLSTNYEFSRNTIESLNVLIKKKCPDCQ